MKRVIKFNTDDFKIKEKSLPEFLLEDNKCLDDRYYIKSEIDKFIDQTGTIKMFGGNTLPDGWLLCDGSELSRETYKELFNAIGITWGSGNGSTTFNLPNATGRVAQGNPTAGSYISAGLPNITGCTSALSWAALGGPSGAFYNGYGSAPYLAGGTNNSATDVRFSASLSNPIYGNSSTVQPPAFTVLYIIKY